MSQRCCKRIESAPSAAPEVFGWIKASAGQVKLQGRVRVNAMFTLVLAAYNLIHTCIFSRGKSKAEPARSPGRFKGGMSEESTTCFWDLPCCWRR